MRLGCHAFAALLYLAIYRRVARAAKACQTFETARSACFRGLGRLRQLGQVLEGRESMAPDALYLSEDR
jgi:hypothetical protein